MKRLAQVINNDVFRPGLNSGPKFTPGHCESWGQGKGSRDVLVMVYYWLHLTHPDRAKKIDELVFGSPFQAKFLPREDDPAFNIDVQTTLPGALSLPRFERPRLPLKIATASSNPNHYSQDIIDVLGRDDEVKILNAFLDDGASPDFRWMQLAGDGGQGKSRLAWDLIRRADRRGWHSGFLRAADMPALAGTWADWTPDGPTLVVFDYVLGIERLIGDAMEALARPDRKVLHKVRFLLVERQAWPEGGLSPSQDHATGMYKAESPLQLAPSDGAAAWFREVVPEIRTGG
ncbi:hypothetical protein SAMN05216258_1152 [Albimonas pacifica]|uniref:Uncharacterized protein n=2 Tax=Albimonas pacifica TaxID=1114924 RepID=A0A1I3NZ82_9RHOB|nr:hypothetical protein SAMN05216258_1152 [Albimonas pacifica]